MEQLYAMLSEYNKSINYEKIEWPLIYTENKPPVYWSILGEELKKYDKSMSCFEIGSGAGDILSLIVYLKFKYVSGIEMDEMLSNIANTKIMNLFGKKEKICINAKFPVKLEKPVDILVMVNCVYWDHCTTKEAYLNKVYSYYEACGKPSVFLWEVIDDVEQGEKYPKLVQTNSQEVRGIFNNHRIKKIDTYRWPQNTSSKSLYVIERLE